MANESTKTKIVEAIERLVNDQSSEGIKSTTAKFLPVAEAGSLKHQALKAGLDVACGCALPLNSHNHTYFSLLDGISSPQDMVDVTAMRGYGGIGISDHGMMGGVLRAGKAGKTWMVGRLANGLSVTYGVVKLRDHIKRNTLCDSGWSEVNNDVVKALAKELDDADVKVLHDPKNPRNFRLIDEGEITPVTDFKVLSGCELYISWEKDKHKRYKHITVYATGMKGHRALVLLTSIGSIPSRRFIGGGNFFRPRVFVEDLGIAVAEADGELIVTTGCPGSITSEALKDGRVEDARAFFEWGKKTLPEGRFFAELHLCDVSLDFNQRYPKAEDKYFSSLFKVPVSRFRHATSEEALKYARTFHERLRLYTLGKGLRGYEKRHEGSARLAIPDSWVHESQRNTGIETDGTVLVLRAAGITADRYDLLSADDIRRVDDLASDVSYAAKALLDVGMEAYSTRDDAPASPSDSQSQDKGDEDAVSIATSTAPPDVAGFDSKPNSLATRESGAAPVVAVGAPATKKPGKKRKARNLQALDEDSLALLSQAVVSIERFENDQYPREQRTRWAAINLITRAILFVMAEIGRNESASAVNPLAVIRSMFAVPAIRGLGAGADAELLSALAADRLLGLDLMVTGTLDDDSIYSAARAVFSIIAPDNFSARGMADLDPLAGAEDGLEREWHQHPEGNWMEKVNAGLVKLAREYDVPLLLASDAHMTTPDLKPVQDAIIKRGKRRAWHMSRPYAIPPADILGFLDAVGAEWNAEREYLKQSGNCAYRMLEIGVITPEDLIEAFGAGSLLLGDAKSAATFKWKTVVPRIRYENHIHYEKAKALLESGELRAFLPKEKGLGNDFAFTDASINISTALIVVTYREAVAAGLIPGGEKYENRLFSELYLQQEVPHEQLCDFFLVLQHVIDKWRKRGISVGPGRGSSGGMLTANICGITYGDPIVKGFIEARWMNRGRKMKGAHADIDIDVDDRQLAGFELAIVAQDSFAQSIAERALSPLEEILHAETFFSSVSVTHEEIGNRLVESKARQTKDIRQGFLAAMGTVRRNVQPHKTAAGESEIDAPEAETDSTAILSPDVDEEALTVIRTPMFRVGTYLSLKCKAAVKEAIRILDNSPFSELPSYGDPTPEWRTLNRGRLHGLSDNQVNEIYEEETDGAKLTLEQRTAKRRIRLADRLTKDMQANAGLARLYENERDFFMGSVEGDVPGYWDPGTRPPTGSAIAKEYFDSHQDVRELVLDFLNIFKGAGVHAGGMCFGREAFERVPVRADKHGYVGTLEMKDLEVVGILKFDVLVVKTLRQIKDTLRMMVDELPYDRMSWWLPRAIYDRVLGGESLDIVWRHIPKSTREAAVALCRSREMTFQVDTKVFGKELDKITPDAIIKLILAAGDDRDINNDILTDILNAFLALFRPGPMKVKGHIDYIDRMQGTLFTVCHPWIKSFVEETFGVIAYQEQVMKIYMHGAISVLATGEPELLRDGSYVLASEEETDEVRRAMGKKDIKALEKMGAEKKFKNGLRAQGVPAVVANQIWEMIVPFAEYGFNSPHSYHYGIISAVTLFLKAHYPEQFTNVSISLAEAGDAARYVGSIAKDTRSQCVLRSVHPDYFRVRDGRWFPSFALVDGMKTKDIDRIMETQQKLMVEMGSHDLLGKVSAEDFFRSFGELTPSLATLLAQTGALRALGTPREVADGYEAALLRHLKPEKARSRLAAKIAESSRVEREPSTDESVEADQKPVDTMDDLVFDLRPGFAAESGDDDDDGGDRRSMVSPLTKKLATKEPKKERAPTLGKKDREIIRRLLDDSFSHLSDSEKEALDGHAGFEEKDTILSVKSAARLVRTDRAKTSIRYLLTALSAAEAAADKVNGIDSAMRPSWISLPELKTLSWEDGRPIAIKQIYRTTAIPKGVSSAQSNRDGVSRVEPRITWIAEGVEINTKFRRWEDDMSEEQIAQAVDAIKDGKMKTPFIVTIYVGRFTNDRQEVITYYQIIKVEPISA